MLFDKRKYERFEFMVELIIQAESPMEKKPIEYYARTLNISRGGMLIYTIAEFKKNSKCSVRFKDKKGNEIKSNGKVLRIVEEGRPGHLKPSEQMYGFEFSKTFSADEVQMILEGRILSGAN